MEEDFTGRNKKATGRISVSHTWMCLLLFVTACFLVCVSSVPASASILFKFGIIKVHDIKDCDGWLDNSDPYVLIRLGSTGTTEGNTGDEGGCEGDCTFNDWFSYTVTAPIEGNVVRAHVRDKDDGYDPWVLPCNDDCDSNFGGATLPLNDNNTQQSVRTNTSYGDGYNGDGDNDCPDDVLIDYRNYYCDDTVPSAPSSLTVTESGNVYGSLSSTTASWGTASDADSGIYQYDYCIGTSAGACDVVAWTSNGTSRSKTVTYSFTTQGRYYWSVRAWNNNLSTFAKTLYDCSGGTANYHAVGAVRSDTTGFAIDRTKPTIHQYETVSSSHSMNSGGNWSSWYYYPESYSGVTPSYGRIFFSSATRESSTFGTDDFEFSQGTVWDSSGGLTCNDRQDDNVWSPWDTTGQIGIRMFDDANGCDGPSFTVTKIEYDKTFGWYGTDPVANTVDVQIYSNSETTTFDDSASNRLNITNVYVYQNCGSTPTSIWSGNADSITTGFNLWSIAPEGQTTYCVRACDAGGNCQDYFDSSGATSLKVKLYYRKDTQAPISGSISHTDGYQTSTAMSIAFNKGTDASSGIASWVIQRRSSPLNLNVCTGYGAWTAVVNNPASSPWSQTVSTAYCYEYRLVVTDNVSNQAIWSSGDTTKVDTSAPAAGSVTYTNGYNTTGSVSLTLGNGSDPQSDIGTRYLQRRGATLSSDGCGTYGSWGSVATNPALNYNDTTVASGNCYQYRYVVYNNAGLYTINCSDGTTCSSFNTVKVDTSGPVLGTIDAYNFEYGIYVSSPFTLSVAAADTETTVTGCEYSINNGSTWVAADNVCSHIISCVDGQVLNLKLRATNGAGLTTTSSTLTRTCDTPKPSTADSWTDDWTNSGSVNVTLTVIDGGAGMTGGEAGTWYCTDTSNTCEPTTAYTAGNNINFSCAAGSVCVTYLRYFSKDAVGNTEETNSERIRQDLQKPDTEDDWTNNCGSNASPQSPVTISLSPDDYSGSGMTGGSAQTLYCIDTGNTCTPDTSGKFVSVTCPYGSQCTQYVRYRSTDYTGNVEASIQTNCVYQDIHQPEWLDQWDPTDDTGANGTVLVPSENTVNSHGPHSLNNYSVNTDNFDWFRIALTAGRRYCFNSIGGVGDVKADLCTNSTCSSVVATDDNTGGNEQFSFCYTAATTATHYLRLTGVPQGENWYGDVHYWYSLVNSAPAATTNNSDEAELTTAGVSGVTCGCDNWPSGDTDFRMRVYIDGVQECDTGRQNDSCGSSPTVNLSCDQDLNRTEDPPLRFWVTDEDGGICEGFSCEDTLTNHTFNTFSSVPAGWITLNQDNKVCDDCYDDMTLNISMIRINDNGVEAPANLAVSSTTDTGTNGSYSFSWDAVADRSGISDYWFQLSTSSTFATANLIVSKSMGTSTNISLGYGMLTPGTTYYYRVAARSNCDSTSFNCSAATHVQYAATKNFTFSDDDTTQPDAGNMIPVTSTIFDSNTNYSVFLQTGPHTRLGDDQSETFACINAGMKTCSAFYAQEPAAGSNMKTISSAALDAASANVPSIEMDEKTATLLGSQIHWYFEDYSTFGENNNIEDGDGYWDEYVLPEFTAATVDRAGKEDYFFIDRMVIKLTLQASVEEWCAPTWWPFNCTPDRSQPVFTVQTRRYNGSSWTSWQNVPTPPTNSISGEQDFGDTDYTYTLVDTTVEAEINGWNNGLNKLEARVLMSGTMGAGLLETEYEDLYIRNTEFYTNWYWHINSHSAVQFIPLTQNLMTVDFTCLLEDDDNDRGANKDCSPAASLDVDYDCVTGEGNKGRSGACTTMQYTVIDDDDTPPSVTLDAPDYVNAGPIDLEAGASDPTQGDEDGIAFLNFSYATAPGGVCGSSWTSLGTDSGDPDCDPQYCLFSVWSTLPADGGYCIKATARDKDDDRANDWLEGYATDYVIVDTQAPNNPTIASVVDDDGSCSGAALPDDTWQGISSDPCFTWNAATDNGLAGVADYWVYYGSKCTSVVDGDGGYVGNVLTWTNEDSPGEGTFCFWMKVKDRAGNESTPTKLWTIKYDASDPTGGTVTPSNTDYNSQYVDGTFDLDTTFSDGTGSGVASCQYCIATDGACTTEWAASTWSGTGCDQNNITCTNGTTLTLNMRATDNAGNTGTAVAVTRICDALPPTVTQVLPTTDLYTGTSITSGNTSCNDAGSGIPSAAYDVQWCNDGVSKGGCTSAGPWSDTLVSGWNSINYESFTGTAGNWYRFRGRCVDNLGQASGWTYSVGYIMPDTDAPDNPTVTGYDSSSKNETLTSGLTYGYDETTPGPYFEWANPSDNPVGGNSGIKGFYVYFGTNVSADPSSYQAAASPNTYTNSTSLSSGSTYYLRIKTEDNAGNISTADTVFTYKYSSGAYIRVTEIDDDAATYGGDSGKSDGANADETVTKLDGVLAPGGADFEIVLIKLYDEWDQLAASGGIGSKTITVTLSDVGSTGAYIASTNLGGASAGGTSVTGTLTGGEAWIKIKATGSAQATPVKVSATATGLSGTGGRNQPAYVFVSTPTNFSDGISSVDSDVFSPITGGTVMHPVWNHAGDSVVFASRKSFPEGWNLYLLKYQSSAWSGPTRLTNGDMCIQPHSKYTFSSDDTKVLFSARPGCTTNSVVEMYAVDADGSDSSQTLASLEGVNKMISNGDSYWWWDAEWSDSSCAQNGDRIVASLADLSNLGDIELYMVYGLKNSEGLYTETGTGFTPVKITNIGGNDTWNFEGSWSPDCKKIVFSSWTGTANPPKTGIYIVDLTAATLPITSLSSPGVTKVHECTASSCTNGAALFPSFTADGTMVSYMTEPNRNFDITNLIRYGSTPEGDLVSNFFTGANFDNYVEYILDQPTFAPQLIGQSENNEFGLVQCKGASCPNSTNGNPFTYITLKPGSRDGSLSIIYLDSVSNISSNGGLLFYQGAVTAVIPPGAVVDPDLQLSVASSPPSVAPTGDGSQDDILVTIGEAREFFPDGVTFSKDIRLIFQYCDRDDNGYLDVNQTEDCSGTETGGDSYDEDELYVYYWCESGATLGCTADTWVQLDGSIDPVNNTMTVATNHFSTYDLMALNRGRFAPQAFVDLNLSRLHTFPNPWRTGYGDVTFFADGNSTYNAGNMITVNINIFDIRGKLVKTVRTTHNGTIPPSIDAGAAGGLQLATWDMHNNSGNQVASGIYLYILQINDGVFSRSYTGKLAIVR